MRARRVRAFSAAGVVAVVLAAASGCGGSSGSGGGKAAGPASRSAASPGAGASRTGTAPTTSAAARPGPLPVPTFSASAVITEQKLKSLTFKEGSTPGTYGMPVTDLRADLASVSARPVTPAACQDVVDIAFGTTAPVGVNQMINWKSDIYPGGMTLAAYPPHDAQDLFRVLTTDLPLCHAISGTDYAGEAFTNRIVVRPAPKVGDQAIRFQEVAELSAKDVRYSDRVVVLVGDVIATFDMTNTGRQTPFPPALIAQQVQRLAAAQR